ncbi:MAG: hypothetical protein OEP48_07345 [Betaproteobacteria bacterium]|nr:hypothetical protein [Betaproteobacteria bacterium]MDH3435411.1 hypothetical protein [Betaproteobacteria bacterium]
MNSITVALAKLIVALAIATGAWWFAAGQGWIPGRLDSPRAENFKRAIDQHLELEAGPTSRACARLRLRQPADGMGPPGVRFDWTPAGFAITVDERREPQPQLARQIALLAAQGFFDAKPLEDGAIDYALTWKGFAASPRQGCFEIAGRDYDAEVLSFKRKEKAGDVTLYEVIARPTLGGVAAWAQTPEFREAFGEQTLRRTLEPEPVAFELARIEGGFDVLMMRGRPRQRGAMDPLLASRLAGEFTAERLRGAINTWLSGRGAQSARVCLQLPRANEADETTIRRARRTRAAQDEQITYTFYNLLTRRGRAEERVLTGYQSLRTLESLGLAKSELLAAEEFKGSPAAGAVRFTLSPEFAERIVADGRSCVPVGTVQLDDLLRFDPISASNPMPQFNARVALKAYDAQAEALIKAYPHLARLQAVGGALRGLVYYRDRSIEVRSAQLMLPHYQPDLSGVVPPTVDGPAAVQIGPPAQKP